MNAKELLHAIDDSCEDSGLADDLAARVKDVLKLHARLGRPNGPVCAVCGPENRPESWPCTTVRLLDRQED